MRTRTQRYVYMDDLDIPQQSNNFSKFFFSLHFVNEQKKLYLRVHNTHKLYSLSDFGS